MVFDDNFPDFYWFEWMLCRMHVHTGCVNKKGGEQFCWLTRNRSATLVFLRKFQDFDVIWFNFGICFHLFSLVMTFYDFLTLVYTDSFSQNFVDHPTYLRLSCILLCHVSRAILWFFSLFMGWGFDSNKNSFMGGKKTKKSSENRAKSADAENRKKNFMTQKNAKII